MQRALKSLVDFIAALFLLVVTVPLMAGLALSIWIKLGRPVLFRQTRIGKNEKPFTLFKFRSMRNSRDKEGKLLDDAQRLTPFGKALRASSLDELPELFNILKGEMSFIGPRPLLPEYLPFYDEVQKKRHRVRPGLTGLAQVHGRNALNWEEKLAFDVAYVERWSLWLDLTIAWATLGSVLSRRGIHAEGEATMSRFDDYVRAKHKETNVMSLNKGL
ncbi:MAG: sugar transferase [Alphaproteobacteria bacterium]|nr:sugar transferase [Alphaproteobacteria bacterium]